MAVQATTTTQLGYEPTRRFVEGGFSMGRLRCEEAAGVHSCNHCSRPCPVGARLVGGRWFCDDVCVQCSTANGLGLLSRGAEALTPPDDSLAKDFTFRPCERLPFLLLLPDLYGQDSGPDLRKTLAVYKRLGANNFAKDTVLMWFMVGPFLFYCPNEIEFENVDQRAAYERAAFVTMVKYAFLARRGLHAAGGAQVTGGIPMHLELTRVTRDSKGPLLARSAFRLVACEEGGGGVSPRVHVNGVDYTQFLRLKPTGGARCDDQEPLGLKEPLEKVTMEMSAVVAAKILQPHTISVADLVNASVTGAPVDPMQ